MDEIERSVVLPKDARPLEAYGRNYQYSGSGTVIAIYLLPFPSADMSGSCYKISEALRARPCIEQEVKDLRESQARQRAAQTPAGERRWYDTGKPLPFIHDGRCMQVNIEYHIATRKMLRVACNGAA
ncbi:hypothetical protein FHS96_004020 [Sphingomonas zeicaulis]|uniref:hypothetical protein n=1 Tax=Sphingomonas zeicaulis TaxID=1632740 RepID=UPI003D235F72